MEQSRKISLARSEELKHYVDDFQTAKQKIPLGLDMSQSFKQNKAKVMEVLDANSKDWENHRWQLSHRISDVDTLSKIIRLTDQEYEAIQEIEKQYRWAISPYYASLMDRDNHSDPVRLQAVPRIFEVQIERGKEDPMAEEFTNPAGCITRRYPDRLIMNVTNECAMFCRHCQRRRNFGEHDLHQTQETLDESIRFIQNNKEIRDILITGGDPLTMTDDYIQWILSQIRGIEHVEIIRIGSRVPVTMPQRITPSLVDMLAQYKPLFVNIQFNHPQEITEESANACGRLIDSGIPMGNQAVLLNGINNDKHVMKRLNHGLLQIRVLPYYIFHAKKVKGTIHFNTSVDDGIEIMEYLRGYTSGLAIPTYIVNAPGGNGKTPILPEYIISRGRNWVMLRTWEGKVFRYENYPTQTFKD